MRCHCRTRERMRAFSLIEVMVVVIIIGILAATIIPQFVGTTQEAKVTTARSHIAAYESALQRFSLHMERFPATEEGLRVLVEPPLEGASAWRGPYLQMLRPDPWGNPYRYASPGRGPAPYDLWSTGADGRDGGEGPGEDIGNWQVE